MTENILHALAATHTHGMEQLVLARQHINMLAQEQTKPEEVAPLVEKNILLASVLQVIYGMVQNALFQ